MGLDARGVISVVEIIMYAPVLVISAFLSFRHGFARKAGWIFLVILSIIRIIGAVAHIVSELQSSPSKNTVIIYTIMESSGLSPLLVATLGFIRTVTQYSIEDQPIVVRGLRILGIVGTVGLILAISGGVSLGSAKTLSDVNSANTQRHVGSILFAVLFAGAVFFVFLCWQNRNLVLRYRRQLLSGVTATLPFLALRTLFSVLSSYAPVSYGGATVPSSGDESLAKFSLTSSQWGFYLVMSVLMEYIAVLIYVSVGIVTPLSKDLPDYNKTSSVTSEEAYRMGSCAGPQNQYATR